MKEDSRKLLLKAASAIEAADMLLSSDNVDFAAGPAYYAMFYAAEALLYEHGLRYRKHGGVHASFGVHFAKTGVLDYKFHRWPLDAFDKRLVGDYGIDVTLSRSEVAEMIEHAREFVREARRVPDTGHSE